MALREIEGPWPADRRIHSEMEKIMSVVKAGGTKGTAIVETIKADTEKKMTRKDIAEAVGCTVGRVGESVRWLAGNGTDEERSLVEYLVAKPREAKPAKTDEPNEVKNDSADEAKVEAPKPTPPKRTRTRKGARKALVTA